MLDLTPIEILTISFPDSVVLEFQIDIKNCISLIKTDTSFVSKRNQLFGSTTIKIQNWTNLDITEWDGIKFNPVCYNPNFNLREILDCTFEDNLISIKGFTIGTDYWTEYTYTSNKYTVSCQQLEE